MSSPSIKVVLPLADAHTNRRTGGKALCLSRLIAARFIVPKGFVLSADAYRSHLWSSGAREIATAQAEAEEREAVRAAILAQPMPDDIWESVAEAYQRLSWQIGIPEPKVAVRSSAIEDSQAGVGFSGAYESYLNVSGLENLDAAIKRVWASLWSGKAAAYRARYGGSGEPAMGVIVQEMIDAEISGSAFTANPVTGDPRSVGVTIRRDGATNQYSVSLMDFSVSTAVDLTDSGDGGILNQIEDDDKVQDGERMGIVKSVAEQAILIEDAIGGRVEIEWAWEHGYLWILQAGPTTNVPAFFPAHADGEWIREDARTISQFGRGLIADEKRTRILNGRLYSRLQQSVNVDKDAAGLLRDMGKQSPAIREKTSEIISTKTAGMDTAGLVAALETANKDARTTCEWMLRAESLAQQSTEAVAEVVEDRTLARRLLGGIDDVVFQRDALLQELSERFSIAEKSGKLENEVWWRRYKMDVERFARQYGYSFRDAGDAADPSRWRSWVEDPDSVFRMIGAVSKLGNRPTLVTLHSAAKEDAASAEAQALERLPAAKRPSLRKLLESTRGLLRARSEAAQICALTYSALRRLLVEYAGRLRQAGLIGSHDNIFYLSIDELLRLADTPQNQNKQELAPKIALRKHEEWLERRLLPPERLPIGETEPIARARGLCGTGASPGVVSGRARIISTVEEAGEMECGDILVAASPGAAWTPFLAIAGGLVCETGSDLSPAAIFARVYGIPAILGSRGATITIKDGQRITIDGKNGTVSG